jgi:enolase
VEIEIEVADVHAIEVLDSRARPTLSVTLTTTGGVVGRAGVPSGASTGSGEAVERRDGDRRRFGGLGVLDAVGAVNGELVEDLKGRRFSELAELDQRLIELDGTNDKSRLGANAVVGVSMAAARAMAEARHVPLWELLSEGFPPARLPVPHFNVINGGVHAANELDFQEFMLAPLGAPNFAEALRAGAEIYASLRGALVARGLSVGLGDEGGFAPALARPEDALGLLAGAVDDAGYRLGRDGVALALDPASSEFYRDGEYHVAGEAHSSGDMIELYAQVVERFPVWLIEDGLAESDWDGWRLLTERLGGRVLLVGDDIFCTNPATISAGIARGVANAALIKLNQIGTVTETLTAMRTCLQAGWAQFVSHRSGETTDAFIADLATGTGCGLIKAGAPARGERVAKYNRLVEIEDAHRLAYGVLPGARTPTPS